MSEPTGEHSLDELAKGLATGTLSRGKAIRLMGGILVGSALASFPGVAWANDCRRLGRECRRDSQCCSRNCIRQGDDKVCACPDGKSRCNDRCVNLKTNENHCGSCFNRCAEGVECVDGACGGGCADCPFPCACVEDLRTGEQACVADICSVEADCNRCLEGEVCTDGGGGEVGCCGPCCLRDGAECTATNNPCCSGICGEGGTCVCIDLCEPCAEDRQCCSGICDVDTSVCIPEPGVVCV